MSYTPIDIPFIRGQEESVDSKLLTVGPMERVHNSYQERTGRMVERRGITTRATSELDGTVVGSHALQNTLSNDKVIGVSPLGKASSFRYNLAQRQEWITEAEGTVGGPWGYLGKFRGRGEASEGSDTFSPSVAVTSEAIIFAYGSGEGVGFLNGSRDNYLIKNYPHIHVDIYDRDTKLLLRSIKWRPLALPTELADGALVSVKVAGNRFSTEFVVGAHIHNDDDNPIELSRFENSRATKEDVRIYVTGIADATVWTGFDMVAARDDSSFVLGLVNGEAGGICLGFDPGLPLIRNLSVGGGLAKLSVTSRDKSHFIVVATGAGGPEPDLIIAQQDGEIARTSGLPGVAAIRHLITEVRPDNQYLTTWEQGSAIGASSYDVRALAHVAKASPGTVGRSFPGASPIFNDDPDHPGFAVVREMPRDGTEDGGSLSSLSTLSISAISPSLSSGEGGSGVIAQHSQGDIRRVITPPHSIQFEDSLGEKFRIIPYEDRRGIAPEYGEDNNEDNPATWKTQASFALLNHESTIGQIESIAQNEDAALSAGTAIMMSGDQRYHYAGFSGQPWLQASSQDATGFPEIPGTYQYLILCEYIDEIGRIWRSIPSAPITVTLVDDKVTGWRGFPPAGFPPGTDMVLYRTENNGSTFYRVNKSAALVTGTISDGAQNFHYDGLPDAQLLGGEPLYTQGGVLQNDPPPACRHLTVAKSRIWAGALDYSARVQASKFLRPTEGIHWSNRDNFFVDIPEAVTGLSAMDETVVVFSRDHIYLINGEGPNDQGIGTFSSPQLIPSDVGCIDSKSIAVAGPGIFFLSRRGLELLNRGFAQTSFVGDAVRGAIESHPHCLGSEVYQSDKQIRWLMSSAKDGDTADSVVIVHDLRVKTWYVFDYSNRLSTRWHSIGRALSDDGGTIDPLYPRDGMAIYESTLGGAYRETERKDEGSSAVQLWETGWLRPAGLNGGAYGRRLHILGTYQGECDVVIAMSYNDKPGFPVKWQKTWELRSEQYSSGEPVTLELTLPVQKFFSVKFQLTARRFFASNVPEGFQAHGVTIFFDTEGEGPRVGAHSKG